MIYGPVFNNGEWRTRYNNNMYNDVPMVRKIKAQRLWWLGHVTALGKGICSTPNSKVKMGDASRVVCHVTRVCFCSSYSVIRISV